MKSMKNEYPKCPECGCPLILSGDTTGKWSRKINKDGYLCKIINKSYGHPNGASYLECPRCRFSYDTEHASYDESIPELDEWINKHKKELWY